MKALINGDGSYSRDFTYTTMWFRRISAALLTPTGGGQHRNNIAFANGPP